MVRLVESIDRGPEVGPTKMWSFWDGFPSQHAMSQFWNLGNKVLVTRLTSIVGGGVMHPKVEHIYIIIYICSLPHKIYLLQQGICDHMYTYIYNIYITWILSLYFVAGAKKTVDSHEIFTMKIHPSRSGKTTDLARLFQGNLRFMKYYFKFGQINGTSKIHYNISAKILGFFSVPKNPKRNRPFECHGVLLFM